MLSYQAHAIELLQKTERFYDGTNRGEMKLAFKKLIENTERTMLECCPFYMGLVVTEGLKMLDECPDYFD
jgi:hypothetical protein